MLYRLCGGPFDGRVIQALPISGRARSIEGFIESDDYRITDIIDPSGHRLCVAEGYARSLIGDAEIDAAAEWLAARQAPIWSRRMNAPADGWIAYESESLRFKLKRIRDAGTVPEAEMGLTVIPERDVTFKVRIKPGQVLGFVGDEVKPSFVWPLVRPA